MSKTAGVHSLAALVDFRAALVKFAAESRDAMACAWVEIGRTREWLGRDQAKLWQGELRRREQAVVNAKNELDRARVGGTMFGHTPDCTDQKKALALARRRRDEAVEKLRAIKRWELLLDHEVDELRGSADKLDQRLTAGTPRAVAELDRILDALERYLSESAPTQQPLVDPELPDESEQDLPLKTTPSVDPGGGTRGEAGAP